MRLKVFDVIEETLALLQKNNALYLKAESQLKEILYCILGHEADMVIGINSRVKQANSLREKIVRNRFYMDFTNAQDILNNLSDLVGCCIECRFIEDEPIVLKLLREKMDYRHEDGYYSHKDYPNFYLDVQSQQPQIQKNGFSIYRIDGYYIVDGQKVNMELQIKALVHAFWGEIEHKLVYKNTNYYVYDDFMKSILSSIKANLTITDKQLHIIFHQMQETSLNGSGGITESSFEKQISKAINDLFAQKMGESLGFTLNLKNTSTILGHYLFIKDIRYDGGNNDRISALFRTFKKLNSSKMDFESAIEVGEDFYSPDVFVHTLGSYLLSVINEDYDWFVFFNMLFAIEPGNNMEDFTLFLNVIKNYLVDNYWLNTSFVKLPMEESQLIHQECDRMLASALAQVGTIQIIYNEHMVQINRAFVSFIEELEDRVISYSDFKQYESAYYEEWLQRVKAIFHK